MDFTLRIDVELDQATAIARTTDALGEQGFGVLTEIDVQGTLRDKLGIEVEPQTILGACNPQLAHRALEIEPRVATLLPCNVVVRAEGDRTVIEALDPAIIADIPANPELAPVADEAARRIRAALEALAGSA